MGQRIRGRTVVPLKPIGARLPMLLGREHLHNGLHGLMEFLGQEGRAARLLIILPRQLQGIAQGVDLILALPHPAGGRGTILAPCAAVVLFIESVGIGVDEDALGLTRQKPLDHRRDLRIVAEADVMQHLRRGIPQPHSLNIAGNHERVPRLQRLHRRFQRVAKAPFKHLRQPWHLPQRLLDRPQSPLHRLQSVHKSYSL